MEILEKIQEIQRYSPKKGDILLITVPSDYSMQDKTDLLKSVRNDLNKHGFDEDYCSVYLCEGDVKLKVIRKEE